MRALPKTVDDEERVTAAVCPDCPGPLVVKRTGRAVSFRCRVGHVYTFRELLEAKERRREDHFWAVITCLEELAQILDDAQALAGDGLDPEARAFASRIAEARANADRVRSIFESDSPLGFTTMERSQ